MRRLAGVAGTLRLPAVRAVRGVFWGVDAGAAGVGVLGCGDAGGEAAAGVGAGFLSRESERGVGPGVVAALHPRRMEVVMRSMQLKARNAWACVPCCRSSCRPLDIQVSVRAWVTPTIQHAISTACCTFKCKHIGHALSTSDGKALPGGSKLKHVHEDSSRYRHRIVVL